MKTISNKTRASLLIATALTASMAPSWATAAQKPVPPTTKFAKVIEGGQTQSTDPTAYNYIPKDAANLPAIQERSAEGNQVINGFTANILGQNITVPTGNLHHTIFGKGLHIDKEISKYNVPAQVCNYHIDYQNRGEGKIYSTHVGKTVWDCTPGGAVGPELTNVDVKRGVQCARLFVNEEFKGEQCHSINP